MSFLSPLDGTHPDNIDAAALAALAQLATAPGGKEGIAVNTAAGDLLDELRARYPEHPGAIHYAIHAYDNPALKDRGVPYAKIYDKAAPTAAHALHMPAYIFTRTGDWEASIDLNRRSAEAALDQSGDILQTHCRARGHDPRGFRLFGTAPAFSGEHRISSGGHGSHTRGYS